MKAIPIVLLAAGQSKRMRGIDKLMQTVDGMPLLRRSAMIARSVGPVIVALPPGPHPRYAALDGLDVTRVPISDATEGMNASLRGALLHLEQNVAAVMVLLADLPQLTEADLNAVLRARIEHPHHLIWRGASEAGKPGHPVLFDATLLDQLAGLCGDGGAKEVVQAYKENVHLERLPGINALLDLDTPEDWAAWRKTRPES